MLSSVGPRPDKNEIMLALDLCFEHDLISPTASSITANQVPRLLPLRVTNKETYKRTEQGTYQRIQSL
jgi:hypothetical protein